MQCLETGLPRFTLEIRGTFFTIQVTRHVGDSPSLELKPSHLHLNTFYS